MWVVEFYCCFWSLVSARNPDSSEQNSIIWKKLISGVLLPIRLPPSLHSLHFTSLRSRNIISSKIFIITANSYSTVLTFAKFSLACYVIFVCVLVYCHHLFYYWETGITEFSTIRFFCLHQANFQWLSAERTWRTWFTDPIILSDSEETVSISTHLVNAAAMNLWLMHDRIS